jgi:citrate lyase subunit beta / citryl-CoA lyase
MKIYRSLLFIPSASMKMLDKIDVLNPDAFILDLEDSVPEDKKGPARENIKIKLEKINSSPDIFIRINGLDTKYFNEDIKETINKTILGYMVPKFDDLKKLESLINFISIQEKEKNIEPGKIKLILMIENPKGIIELAKLDKSDILPRIMALTMGWEDFTRELTDFGHISIELFNFARMMIIFYAKANGMLAIDSVYRDFTNEDGLRQETLKAAGLGFNGKLAIHPKQVDIINECFMPGIEEIKKMEVILQNRKRIEEEGAINIEGTMYDPPHLIWALKVKKYLEITNRKK